MRSDSVKNEMTLKIAKQIKNCKEWVVVREGDHGRVIGLQEDEQITFEVPDVSSELISDEEYLVIGKQFAKDIILHANRVIGEAFVEAKWTAQEIISDWDLD